MGRPTQSEGRSADGTLSDDHELELEPAYNTDDPDEPPLVWAVADAVQKLLDEKGDPGPAGRYDLATSLTRQLPTVVLYWQVLKLLDDARVKLLDGARREPGSANSVTLFLLLFPGEGRDNTGIKDLNDNVLGYTLSNEYLVRRQVTVLQLFGERGFFVVGQDYKTASVLATTATRQQFEEQLRLLDAELRRILLDEILPRAARDAEANQETERLRRVRKLENVLRRDPAYRFDLYYGVTGRITGKAPLDPFVLAHQQAVEAVFLLVTEALKGAGLARVIAKGRTVKTQPAKQFRSVRGDRGYDERGKQFQPDTLLRAARYAGAIKALMTTPVTRDDPTDYRNVYVDSVWTTAFLGSNGEPRGNPDVIRAVRKKRLERPPLRDGTSTVFTPQKELLELWVVVLNLLDFIKDFVLPEFRRELVIYHNDMLAAFLDVVEAGRPINWSRMERVLTHDLRQTSRVAVLGRASEFQFYSGAASYSERIFLGMDIRDLGVDALLLYEAANADIVKRRSSGLPLLERTLLASDPITERRRFTYDRVRATFRKYYDELLRTPVKRDDVRAAFGVGLALEAKLPSFAKCVQIMLGGDEVFVAAHPAFAPHLHQIVADLDRIRYGAGTLNMRAVVAFSRAPIAPPEEQRTKNKVAHQQALKVADRAGAPLKALEAAHRRIERLIEKLQANPDKQRHVAGFSEELATLRLRRVFARFNHGAPKLLSRLELSRLLVALRAESVGFAVSGVELVDFDGRPVDARTLEDKAKDVEARVRRVVGRDNVHIDPPPIKKPPKWVVDPEK